MDKTPEYLQPEHWLDQIFSSTEARRGGVVKRQIRDVERLVGRRRFLNELDRRGFQAVENGRHFVIFCNAQPIRRVATRKGFAKPLQGRLDAALNRFANRF